MRVVCILDIFGATKGEAVPIKGEVYTVRETVHMEDGSSAGYRLVEIVNQPQEYWWPSRGSVVAECVFDTRCFRRVTDISALQSLTKIKELEDA